MSVPCHVTNHVKDYSQEIFSDAHLVLGLFIYLGHCDALFRRRSLHLLTATVRFDALNDFSDSLIFSSNLERTYSLHDGWIIINCLLGVTVTLRLDKKVCCCSIRIVIGHFAGSYIGSERGGKV